MPFNSGVANAVSILIQNYNGLYFSNNLRKKREI